MKPITRAGFIQDLLRQHCPEALRLAPFPVVSVSSAEEAIEVCRQWLANPKRGVEPQPKRGKS